MAKSWYMLQVFVGHEAKIERNVRTLLERKELDSAVVTDVKVPVEEIIEIKDGKKKTKHENFMPGYLMVELDLPEIGWKDTCTALRRIQGVTGFVGTDPNVRPRAISAAEAKNLLQKIGVLKSEKTVKIKQSYSIGDIVKITDGPFASFSGNIEEVNDEKDKLRVNVQIFGRATPVEVSVLQVERV